MSYGCPRGVHGYFAVTFRNDKVSLRSNFIDLIFTCYLRPVYGSCTGSYGLIGAIYGKYTSVPGYWVGVYNIYIFDFN